MTQTSCEPLLEVDGLNVIYRQQVHPPQAAVIDATFQISSGEIVGIFGESGSGKTSLGLALLNLLPRNADRRAHSIRFLSRELLSCGESEMRSIRGKQISIMYQEAALALNPVMRVGDQIAEVLRAHETMNRKERAARVCELLCSVSLDRRPGIHDAYPHELSGGERHRVVIAQALGCHPALVIADEPTAGLDRELRPEILDLMARLRSELNVSFLLITHDRKMLARVADRTLEMTQGRISERPLAGPICWSREAGADSDLAANLRDSPALMVIRNASKSYSRRGVHFRSAAPVKVLENVHLEIQRGSIVCLVGPSGSGKSTLARCLALWEKFDAGEILFNGADVGELSAKATRKIHPRIQLLLQDSAAALNPNLTAEEAVAEPLLIQDRTTSQERGQRVIALLEEVGLHQSVLTRKVTEFSGGQRQRLAIARALILNPELIIFDEPTTGLDYETQQAIVALLEKLRQSRKLTYVVISHDLELMSRLADWVATMRDGTIVSFEPAARQMNASGIEKGAVALGDSR